MDSACSAEAESIEATEGKPGCLPTLSAYKTLLQPNCKPQATYARAETLRIKDCRDLHKRIRWYTECVHGLKIRLWRTRSGSSTDAESGLNHSLLHHDDDEQRRHGLRLPSITCHISTYHMAPSCLSRFVCHSGMSACKLNSWLQLSKKPKSPHVHSGLNCPKRLLGLMMTFLQEALNFRAAADIANTLDLRCE